MKTDPLSENFGSLSETINGLRETGYTHDFNIKKECGTTQKVDLALVTEDFEIDKIYRFEGPSDPDYQSILYAISSKKHGVKGLLVNGYGISSDPETSRIVEQLRYKARSNSADSPEASPEKNHRPGAHVGQGLLIKTNLEDVIHEGWSDMERAKLDKKFIALSGSETVKVRLGIMRCGAELKPHRAQGPMSLLVLRGSIIFRVDEQSVQLDKGDWIDLKRGESHSVEAQKDSSFLLTIATFANSVPPLASPVGIH